jgi:stage V sporulation protein R
LEREETEDEKRLRIFEQQKRAHHEKKATEFYDVINVGFSMPGGSADLPPVADYSYIERELYNNTLWNSLKHKTPVEPTEDLLRYLIDNSRVLSGWEKDILEIIRMQGRQYYWSLIKTKYLNEGFACFIHEKIMRKLFNMGLMTSEEHAEYNYSNSLVKAMNPYAMNPYLIGSTIWYDIEDRWDKGKHGDEWEEEPNLIRKKEWDTKEMKGWEKVHQILRTNHDWFFMNEFLTNDLTRDLNLYIYIKGKEFMAGKFIVTDYDIDQVRQMIINSFSHSGVPKIRVVDGNYRGKNDLLLEHEHIGIDLDDVYTHKTLEHIHNLWGNNIYLKTMKDKVAFSYKCYKPEINPIK